MRFHTTRDPMIFPDSISYPLILNYPHLYVQPPVVLVDGGQVVLAAPPAVPISVGRRKTKLDLNPEAELAVEALLHIAGFELRTDPAGSNNVTLFHPATQLAFTLWSEQALLQIPGVTLPPGWAQQKSLYSSAIEIEVTAELLIWLVKKNLCKTGYRGYQRKITLVSVAQVQEIFGHCL